MARTVQALRLIIAVCLLTASSVFARTGIDDTHKRLFYLGSEEEISSGVYLFGSDRQKLGSLYFPFVYDIENKSSYNPYISLSAGYGAARYKADKKWAKLYGLKLGGGIRYRPADDWDLRIGGSYQWCASSQNTAKKSNGYDIDATYTYRPYFGEWKPYLQTAIRYKYASLGDKQNVSSITGRLKAGLVTPVFAYPFELPVRMEIYGEAMVLQGDMHHTFGGRYLGIAGAKAYMGSHIFQDWISELTLGVQYVKGRNVDGLSIGLGVKF